ncbi:RNA polymerase sigma subunit ECF family protein [Sphingomonas metalli]|uniref:RNA polymerase sigma subunit ECF family protein n=1 Tax=Sphingomonas metalli TaxID=1779358 RepID=A0A916WQ44_9SPHN|nr:RNA polymerase sigma factor [Sphingomonas metalli]GGB19136.1 RNA polymerase sigma subunit ECF family protein [Sphingomonas metalli]
MADEGLKAVFLAQRPMLMRLLVARLGRADEAEDALQDMWLRLDSLADRPVAQPAAFLYRVAANLATDRRIAAQRRAGRDTAWLDLQPDADELPSIERALVARDEWRTIETILAAMPERMAEALRLFRLEGCPQRQIAERMGISLSGVEKLLQRAYRQIHKALAADDAGMDLPRRLPEERGRP